MSTSRSSRALAALAACLAAPVAAGAGGTAQNEWFPLRVGASWTYACEVEGEPQPGKTLRLTSMVRAGGREWYRGELRIAGDPKPLVNYYTRDPDGSVWRASGTNGDGRVALVPARAVAGSTFDGWRVAGIEAMSVMRRAGTTRVLRIDNFDIEAPDVTQQRRYEWLGRDYGSGIGPVGEADGLGGSCTLTAMRPGPAARKRR